jgi:hypothetical protein
MASPSGLACCAPQPAPPRGAPPLRWSRQRSRPLRHWRAPLARPATACRAGRCGQTARGPGGSGSSWPPSSVCAGVVVSCLGVWLALVGQAPSLPSSLDVAAGEALPSLACCCLDDPRYDGLLRRLPRRPTGRRLPAYTRGDSGCGPPSGGDLPCSLADAPNIPLPRRRRVPRRCSPGSRRLPWPSPCLRGSAPSGSLAGSPLDAAGFASCDGLRCGTPSAGGYAASAPPVTRQHWAPATWPPGSYHDRTCPGQPTMTYQGTPVPG